MDLKSCMEKLFDAERQINAEFAAPVTAETEATEVRQKKEIIGDFLGEFMNEDLSEFTPEFFANLENNTFLLYYLADRSIAMYSRVDPKLIYFATNSLFAKEYETKFPLLFPLYTLIDLGITNYYDVSGSLNVSRT